MTVILISLIAILALYFIIVLSPLKVCAICSAVSITWLGLLIMYFIGWHQETTWLGILMGGSVVGFLYSVDSYWKENKTQGTWLLKLSIVIFGFLLVQVIINQTWNVLVMVLSSAMIVGSFGLMLLKKDTQQQSVSSSLQKKLDHCCD